MARKSTFAPVVVPVVEERVWSEQQEDIFNWFEYAGLSHLHDTPDQGQPHLIVRARAGTGKTTTIIEGVNRAPESSILVCAFSKKIAEALNAKITNSAATAQTLHSVGYAAIRKQWRGMPVAKSFERGDWLTDQVVPKDTPKPIRKLVTLLHTKGRDMLPLTPTPSALLALALEFDYVPDEGWGGYSTEWVVANAGFAMDYARDNEPRFDIGIDFADMIYLPLVWNLLSPTYEMVVVDEAQDLTLAQLTIAQRLCSGRICIVGDDKQAIYGFRGADSGSLDRLKTELSAGELPLTTTYRCAHSIVRRAQVLVPDIQAGVGNPEGVVDACDLQGLLAGALPGDFILSRLNAPLVSVTLQLLRGGKRARMAGRDIAAGITNILKKLRVQYLSPIEDVVTRVDAWERKETTRYAAYGQLDLVDRTRDQAEMIRAIAEDSKDSADLLNRIQWLFTDDPEADTIVCSSIHKAKGLESSRVFVLTESLYRRGVTEEEHHLSYVATTRAKLHLTLVTGIPSLAR